MNAWRHWWPAVLWAGAIFLFSTGYFGGDDTSQFIIPFLRWLLPGASPETLNEIHFLIRKASHVGEYFLFSLLVLRGVRGEAGGWRWRWGVMALLVAAGYATLDEFHQSFVPERGGAAQDVLLDSAGAVVAQAAARLWFGKRENRK